MTALNSEGLEKAVAQAIFDPGATEGYKGDRTLTEWQVQAVMRAITSHTPALPPVDGLEVVAFRHPEAGWAHVQYSEIDMHCRKDGLRPIPLVALSQASSVIAGLRARTWPTEAEFQYGQPVEKYTGEARWDGRIVSAYLTTKGSLRYVVEVDPQGFQMIAIPGQLRARQALEDHNG